MGVEHLPDQEILIIFICKGVLKEGEVEIILKKDFADAKSWSKSIL